MDECSSIHHTSHVGEPETQSPARQFIFVEPMLARKAQRNEANRSEITAHEAIANALKILQQMSFHGAEFEFVLRHLRRRRLRGDRTSDGTAASSSKPTQSNPNSSSIRK